MDKLEVGEITIHVQDAAGKPVSSAEVKITWESGGTSTSMTDSDGRTIDYDLSLSTRRKTINIGVRWNQELIAQQDFVLSWQ